MSDTTLFDGSATVGSVPSGDPRAETAADELQSRAPQQPQGLPDSTGLRLLAVHAHPDDESSKGAAMMAAYADAGAEVMVATATGGELGDLLNPAAAEIHQCHRDLPGVRREEMRRAAEALGVQHVWLGFTDSGLPEGDPTPPLPFGCFAALPLEQAAAPLVRLIRRFRPHVITCYDESGGYPHPDHIMSHRISVEAYHAAGDPQRYPDCGQPWAPQKLYYDRAFNPGRLRALHEALVEAGIESPYEERLLRYEKGDRPDWLTTHEVTTKVPVGDYLEKRDAALRAHRTQVDPEGFFFATPNDFLREVWPYDDFVLVESAVETELPEYDLFAGLREQS
ncbi:mycothiol conjugate amidase Mca [Nesterenkonia sp.]|uniref:mycothiol conjugate amidase Mca n=1 Tax=Nesterenkonia sp. TaxID=704201 RepID=UPI00262D82EC|nr:mycothiol conjugate amidase Mca [Nesterenkonia sp.]